MHTPNKCCSNDISWNKLKKNVPVGRLGRISDIETAAVFLCSDAASFINGEILVVDGGQWLAGRMW